jgi:pimeloyl-ACP methyl ester carboxylesterase
VDDPNRIDGVFKEYGGWDKPDGWGRVAAWAWGFSRVVDWIETRPELDKTRVAVVGHSRGGKTALWATACDPRIAMGVSNNSGTGGAHLNESATPGSEQVAIFKKVGSWNFFCPNFLKLDGRETVLEHDADDLLRLIAPRLAYVASASQDKGAGPQGEFEAARRAGELWTAYGLSGLTLTAYPRPDTVDHTGCIGYHLRTGKHQLTAADWRRFLDFADRNGWCPDKRMAKER